jgi:hypothetical protein
MTSPTSVFDGPPLDPSSPEARQWVLDELAKGRYTTEPSPWQRFVEWLQHLLAGQPGAGLVPAWGAALVVLVVLAVVALVVIRLLRAEPSTPGGRPRGAVVDDEGLSAADYRARAAGARARGDWDAVLLDSYRALAASAVERTLLTDLPGRTAHEVALALESVFPTQAESLAASALEFDAVRYGHRRTTQAQADAAADLDATLRTTRPTLGQLVGP